MILAKIICSDEERFPFVSKTSPILLRACSKAFVYNEDTYTYLVYILRVVPIICIITRDENGSRIVVQSFQELNPDEIKVYTIYTYISTEIHLYGGFI